MILQKLTALYEQLVEDPEASISRAGFSTVNVHFELVLNADGGLVAVNSLQERDGKKSVPRPVSVPQQFKRSGKGLNPYFLCDNTGYCLGANKEGTAGSLFGKFSSFKELHHTVIGESADRGLHAVARFLETWNPEDAPSLEHWEDMAGKNVVFRLDDGERQFVHERPAARKAWLAYQNAAADDQTGLCLVSGAHAPLAKLHPSIRGVRGAQTSGGNIVSFNRDAFLSFGKEQSYNAPVSKDAAFAYTTALNHLLAKDSKQRIQIGDATTVFWSDKPTPKTNALMHLSFAGAMEQDDSASAQDTALVDDIRLTLIALKEGKKPVAWDEANVGFYILGLAPNNARLAVRFWHASTVEDISLKLARHFQDMEMVKRFDTDPSYPGMFRMLLECAPLRKADNIPPILGGELMRAILTGQPYPQSLLARLIGRIRADGDVNYLRASMIKGILNRRARQARRPEEETVSLNEDSTNIGYRLGRLFAVLESLQRRAVNPQATIKDRYMAAASSTPNAVFPTLLRTAQSHIKKEAWGDKAIAAILQGVPEDGAAFPRHLGMDDQGRFFLGYYHQLQHDRDQAKAAKAKQQDKE